MCEFVSTELEVVPMNEANANMDDYPRNRRIDASSAGVLMTTEEFDAVDDYDDLYRYELVHGVLVVHDDQCAAAAGANEELGYLLWQYREKHPNQSTIDAMLPRRFVYTHDSRYLADRVVWIGLGRRPEPTHDVPAVVAEFVSAGRRDWPHYYSNKWHEYRTAGVAEFWLIDRYDRCMRICRSCDEIERRLVIANSEVYRTKLLPGFYLPVERLLSAADVWEKPQR
jgi:Uma2 family endonuclease